LTTESRRVAQEESNRQTGLLMREIALHKQTDAELQLARYLADQANQAKSRYITGISHELRTPLNSILGYAQLLDNDKTIPNNRKQAIRVIRRSGEHLLSLIEGTLDIARIESGKLTFENKLVNFPEFINQIVSMFELQARNKGLEFRFEIQGELPAVVKTDQKRLTQILINILGNALKFTKSGAIIFRVKYARELAHIEIEDTGPGIAESEYYKIFEPFSRGTAADQINVGGTGLGLTISKLLTELMGGELTFTSKLGIGTTFRIHLFLPQSDHGDKDVSVVYTSRVGYLGQKRKILVVDNEEVDRELLINILEPLGFEMAQASNGQECLDVYQAFKPDLILMDLAMPVMDGWEASYIIRKIHQSNTIIGIVSANAYDKNLENSAGIEASDFIVKPVSVEELLDWIGQKLSLTWMSSEMNIEEKLSDIVDQNLHTLTALEMTLPPKEMMSELLALIDIGYVKGINNKLDLLLEADARYSVFVERMRLLSSQFEIDKMKTFLQEMTA
jgi:CheY-like chemotaxis protein/nitrogen-specific signal transduction histidine kinase